MSGAPMRSVVILQYAGDYAEAFRRLEGGGAENYYAQRYSLEVVAALVNPATAVTVICCSADKDEDVVLSNGVRVINLYSPGQVDTARVQSVVQSVGPTHLCLRTPMVAVLQAAIRNPAVESILLTLADSFEDKSWRGRWRAWRLARLLNHPKVIAVGNHGKNASESLRRIGVRASKIIPWDWPHEQTPHQSGAKAAPTASAWTIFFVGLIIESKGVGDLIRAVRLLKDEAIRVNVDCAGKGEIARFAALADELGIADQVRLTGLMPHSEVIPAMRKADLVVIPSRHAYPEGFPMTIYEALTSRTPLVASDHPMYAAHLASSGAAAVFAASDPAALARAIKQTMNDPVAYVSMSAASARAWDQLQLAVTWGDLLGGWLPLRQPDAYGPLKHALSSTR